MGPKYYEKPKSNHPSDDTEALLNKYCDTVPETPHKTELIITIRIPGHFLFFIYPP